MRALIAPLLVIAGAVWEIIGVALGAHLTRFDGILWPSLLICWVLLAVTGAAMIGRDR